MQTFFLTSFVKKSEFLTITEKADHSGSSGFGLGSGCVWVGVKLGLGWGQVEVGLGLGWSLS